MQTFKITKKGKEKIQKELDHLIDVERPAVIKAIAEARELGDLSENAEYSSAREEQGLIESKINTLTDLIARAEVIDVSKLSGKVVGFGATVTIEDADTEKKKTYTLLSEYESNLDKGIISITSPVGKALVGKEEGDDVEIKTPSGIKDYEILKVEYKKIE
jgi:transcription elongation factor GreA